MVEWGFKLRLTDEEKAEWGAYARSIGMTLGGFVKSVVRAQISGGTRAEIPPEARAVKKKETVVEKKPERVLPAPRPTEPRASPHTETIAALKQNIKGLTTGTEFSRHLSLKEKNSRAMQIALGVSKPQEVLEPEVLPALPADRPEIAPAESQRAVTRKPAAPRDEPPTVVNDNGAIATRDWGDILPIGNPRAEAAAKEKRKNVEAFNNSRRRL